MRPPLCSASGVKCGLSPAKLKQAMTAAEKRTIKRER